MPAAAPQKPDLVVSALADPAATTAAGLRPATTVRNAGRKRAAKSTLRFYLSRDARKDAADVRIGAAGVKALAPRKTQKVTPSLTVPGVIAAGRYRLLACADDAAKVKERNERNNCRASRGSTTVGPPAGTPLPAPTATPVPVPAPSPVPEPSPLPTATPEPGDTTPPDTAITSGPDPVTAADVATFEFSAGEPGATFRCRLDGGDFAPCSSPKQLTALAAEAAHTFAVAAVDAAGNVDATPAARTWRVEPPAPQPPGAPADTPPADPSTLAPAPATGDVTDTAAGFAFLLDAQPGADDVPAALASVVRGRAVNRMGAAVSGARVSVVGHPGYGHTATRADGRFDLAVAGVGALTLEIARAGYLPVQRTLTVAPATWAELPEEVVLVPFDVEATTVQPDAATTQTVQAGPVEDASGERQATLLFEPGTDAQMRMPDGSTEPLEELTVRATEYTVGAAGEEAMPGTLPATSAYTYAVELSVDQAVAAGAEGVEFTKPVVAYLENFLDMPAGTEVPAGSYDREAGKWVPEPDGRVIAIVGEAGGAAQVDVTGDGVADDGATLGLDPAEKARLAALYAPGDTLWRVPVGHFSAWDFNWPAGPPAGATPPNGAPPAGPPPDCDAPAAGSVIGCESQTLGEDAALAGVDAGLHYRSNRLQPVDGSSRTRLNLTGASVPPGLERVELTAFVAGRRFTHVVEDPGPNLSHEIAWDGLDGYGRRVQGEQPLTAEVRFVYKPRYYESREEWDASFASLGGVPIAGSKSRGEIALSRFYRSTIGGWDARSTGLGGWTLGMHHAYDPGGRRLHLGDGATRSGAALNLLTVKTVAGGGSGGTADGIQATQADLFSPAGVVATPDGGFYVSDSRNSRIRRVAPDGTITTVAGTGVEGFNGDGPVATAQIGRPAGLDLAPDGTLYFADPGNERIRRIRDGVVETVAGGGGALADDIPATDAWLFRPVDLALAPDGSIYICDEGRDRIRVVNPAGRVTTVAGGGFSEPPGIPARESRLHFPEGIDLAPDGSLLIAESDADRISRVSPDGIITIAAGKGPAGSPVPGDGGPATATTLADPYDVVAEPDGSFDFVETPGAVRHVDTAGVITTVAGARGGGVTQVGDGLPAGRTRISEPVALDRAADGALLVVERFGEKVRRIASPLPGVTGGDVLIASEGGAEVYRFSRAGRHLETRDALTGAVLWTFAYDGAGRLQSATDRDGMVTAVERDGDGKAVAVVAPGGQRTELTVEAGLLARIENPAGEAVRAAYEDGLLTSYTDAADRARTYGYDADRRLVSAKDPDDGEQTLVREPLGQGWRVTRTTAAGLKVTYDYERLPSGELRRRRTAPMGAVTEELQRLDGSTLSTLPDGETRLERVAGDPRFGLTAPVRAERTRTLPGGDVVTSTATATATLADPFNPFSLVSMTRTATLAGKTEQSAYVAATRTITDTSPTGIKRTRVLDVKGRTVSDRASAGVAPTEYEYDAAGLLKSIRQGADPATQRRLDLTYDAKRRIETITDPALGTRTYTYDDADRVATLTEPGGRVSVATYDAAGDPKTLQVPGGGTHTFAFDAFGQPTSHAAPGLAAQLTGYDADHRRSSTTLPGGAVVDVDFAADGRVGVTTLPGTTVTPGWVGQTGRLGTLERVTGAEAHTLTRTFDGPRLMSESAGGSAAGAFAYDYDAAGRLSRLDLTSGTDAAPAGLTYTDDGLPAARGPLTFTRGAAGGRTSNVAIGGVASVALTYDEFGDVATRKTTVNGTVVHTLTLTRDRAGRPATESETLGGTTTGSTFGYDTGGHLQTVTRTAGSETHGWSPNGNRTSRQSGGLVTPEAATYDGADHVTSVGGVPHTVDANGFLTVRGADTFAWSAAGDLLSATVGDVTAAYAYDGFGRRVARVVAGAREEYLYGDPEHPWRVTAVRDAAGVLTVLHHDDAGLLVALDRGGVRSYVATDLVGTPRAVFDGTGAALRTIRRDAFGLEVAGGTGSFTLPIGFAGGLEDPLTGFVRFGRRDYDPRSARWTSTDPIGFAAGQTNLFAYLDGDPLSSTDPSGLCAPEKGPVCAPPPPPGPTCGYESRVCAPRPDDLQLGPGWTMQMKTGKCWSKLTGTNLCDSVARMNAKPWVPGVACFEVESSAPQKPDVDANGDGLDDQAYSSASGNAIKA